MLHFHYCKAYLNSVSLQEKDSVEKTALAILNPHKNSRRGNNFVGNIKFIRTLVIKT